MDEWLLRLINGSGNPTLDVVFRFVSNFPKMRWVFAAPLAALLIFGTNRWRYALLLAAVAVALADMSSTAVKEVVQRERAFAVETIRHVEEYRYTATRSSFPSNHSANTMAGALVLAWHLRRKKWAAALCLLLPLAVGYSRVYLGVHFPSDVAGGFLVGGACACGVLWLHWRKPVVSFEEGREQKFSWRRLGLWVLVVGLFALTTFGAVKMVRRSRAGGLPSNSR